MFTFLKALFVYLALTFPVVSFAEAPKTFKELIEISILPLMNVTISVVGGLCLLVFVYGLAKFIFNSGDEDKVDEGKQLMFWGVIALFVMVSVWGLITFLHNAIFTGQVQIPPKIPPTQY